MINNNIAELIHEVKQRNAKKIMIQIPEGLKVKTVEMIEEFSKHGIDAIFAADPSYGACDLRDEEAKKMDCDLLVHAGHNKFYLDFPTAVPVLYFPWTINVKIDADFSSIKEKRIGLVSSIQHLNMINEVKDRLTTMGKTAVTGGQILGCWTANAEKIENEIDAFLFIGTGEFHSLALNTKKIVYCLDLERNSINKIDKKLMEKRRYANIFNAKDAKTFGILVSTKKGQNQLIGRMEDIKKYLENKGRKAVVIVMNEINDSKLMGMKIDAYINTACPRLMDDSWSKPFINAYDINLIFD